MSLGDVLLHDVFDFPWRLNATCAPFHYDFRSVALIDKILVLCFANFQWRLNISYVMPLHNNLYGVFSIRGMDFHTSANIYLVFWEESYISKFDFPKFIWLWIYFYFNNALRCYGFVFCARMEIRLILVYSQIVLKIRR